jgi:hypothetical protein
MKTAENITDLAELPLAVAQGIAETHRQTLFLVQLMLPLDLGMGMVETQPGGWISRGANNFVAEKKSGAKAELRLALTALNAEEFAEWFLGQPRPRRMDFLRVCPINASVGSWLAGTRFVRNHRGTLPEPNYLLPLEVGVR